MLWRLRDPAVRASQLWPLAAPVLALNAVTVASEPLSGHRRGGGGQEEHRARAAIRQLPAERTAERALVVGSIAVITGFLIGGLSEYNLGDSEVVMVVWVIMALPSSAGEASIA
ncbi:MAG TPA: hypothetical protein VF197_23215 [Methylomirabilota bacterium]